MCAENSTAAGCNIFYTIIEKELTSNTSYIKIQISCSFFFTIRVLLCFNPWLHVIIALFNIYVHVCTSVLVSSYVHLEIVILLSDLNLSLLKSLFGLFWSLALHSWYSWHTIVGLRSHGPCSTLLNSRLHRASVPRPRFSINPPCIWVQVSSLGKLKLTPLASNLPAIHLSFHYCKPQ